MLERHRARLLALVRSPGWLLGHAPAGGSSLVTEMRFAIEVIGGPYDGAPGMYVMMDYDGSGPPERLRFGRCSGRGECNYHGCGEVRRARLRPHVAFWIPAVEDPPVATEPYELEEFEEPAEWPTPVARYVVGGLPRSWQAEAREAVPAGAAGGVCYG